MCGRFVLEIPPGELVKVYQLATTPELSPRYNIAPGQTIAAVRQDCGGQRELAALKWGLVPSWAKEASIGYKMINARSETAHEKPSFKNALRSRRCIIPASGFYEWSRQGKEKVPHYIRFIGGEIMSLAGIWESWKSPEGVQLETCTILTTAANEAIKKIHQRMPVLLHGDEIDTWLSRDIVDTDQLTDLFQPYPSYSFDVYTVSKEVNKVDFDRPEFIQPAVF